MLSAAWPLPPSRVSRPSPSAAQILALQATGIRRHRCPRSETAGVIEVVTQRVRAPCVSGVRSWQAIPLCFRPVPVGRAPSASRRNSQLSFPSLSHRPAASRARTPRAELDLDRGRWVRRMSTKEGAPCQSEGLGKEVRAEPIRQAAL